MTVRTGQPNDRRRLRAEARLQRRRLRQITDRLVVDEDGHIEPAPPGPSIFDVWGTSEHSTTTEKPKECDDGIVQEMPPSGKAP
jgi:hypothetical protein